MSRVPGVLVAALTLLAPVIVRAATLPQYVAALAAEEQDLRAAAGVLHSDRPLGTSYSTRAAARFGRVDYLQSHGGVVMRVDSTWLVQDVRRLTTMTDRRQAAGVATMLADRLGLMASDLGGARPHVTRDPIGIARAVLSRADYQSEPAPGPSSLDLFLQRIGDAITKFLNSRHGPTGPLPNPRLVYDVVVTIAVVLGVAFFVFLVWLIVQAIAGRSPRYRPVVSDSTEAALVEARDKDSILELADSRARSGEFREAFRLVYLATLVALDSGGVLRFDRSKTNWEYLRALRSAGHAEIYDSMRPLTHDFDRLWYGFKGAGMADFQRARKEYERLTAPSDPTPAGVRQ
jgi:hypothetical protein